MFELRAEPNLWSSPRFGGKKISPNPFESVRTCPNQLNYRTFVWREIYPSGGPIRLQCPGEHITMIFTLYIQLPKGWGWFCKSTKIIFDNLDVPNDEFEVKHHQTLEDASQEPDHCEQGERSCRSGPFNRGVCSGIRARKRGFSSRS
jgi:hypothetical protein